MIKRIINATVVSLMATGFYVLFSLIATDFFGFQVISYYEIVGFFLIFFVIFFVLRKRTVKKKS